MKIGSLFSGAGGLDMAVEQVFGGHTVWHSEIDKAASKVLAHHWPEVPNLGDITQIGWDNVEPVDILCGGFPCQDVSAAGKRAGIKDGTRSGLWAVFADAIDALRPQFVVIENVRGLLSAAAHRTEDDAADHLEPGTASVGNGTSGPVLRAAGAVLGDLADLGYDAQWATVAAASVGAPHRRERVFILASIADPNGERRVSQKLARGMVAAQPSFDGHRPPLPGDASNTSRNRRHEGRPESARLVGGFDAAVSGDEPGVALLPTPCAQQSGNSPEEHLRKKPGRRVVTDLAILVENGLLQSGGALLPTPRTSDTNGAGQHGDGGMDLRTTISLLPTPTAGDGMAGGCRTVSDGKGGRREVDWDDTTRSTGDGGASRLRDTPGLIHGSQWGKYAPAIARWEALTRTAPAPTEPNKNSNPRLAAQFSEWMMGWSAGWVTDPAIGISRNDQLRIVGNGVCPQQATAALTWLLKVAEVAA